MIAHSHRYGFEERAMRNDCHLLYKTVSFMPITQKTKL